MEIKSKWLFRLRTNRIIIGIFDKFHIFTISIVAIKIKNYFIRCNYKIILLAMAYRKVENILYTILYVFFLLPI